MADLEAVKQGLRGLPREQLPRTFQTLKEGWHLLIPVGVLLYQLIIAGSSISRAGMLSILSIIIISWFRRETRLGLRQIFSTVRDGALGTVPIAALCACAGIIVGVVSISGLGVKFGSAILPLAGGSLFITLFLTAILCLLLGMGLPTTASYIIAASIGVPALLKLGVNPLAAHLFVFYFACLSAITPPECGAIFTACGFSKTNVMETGWIAMRLAFPAYIVPFIFVYHPVLLMRGAAFEIVYQFLMSVVGVAAMAMAFTGVSYFGNIKWSIPSRLFFAASFFGFIIPGRWLDIWGVIFVIAGFLTTPQTWRQIAWLFSRSSSRRDAAQQGKG
jgi:TRAP transporter 4TM/12TM fusion protein